MGWDVIEPSLPTATDLTLYFKTMEKKNVGAWIKLLTLIGTITS